MQLADVETKSSKVAAEIRDWLSRTTQKSGVRTLSRLGSALATGQGAVRTENQDRAVVASYAGHGAGESFDLYVICDGLGGMREGGRCASLALSTFICDLIRTRTSASRVARLRRALEVANAAVYRAYKEAGGTTIAAILIDGRGASLIAVGDSRIYVYGSNNELVQLTTDDTIAARVAQFQGVAAAAIDQGPFSNQLAQFVGQRAPITPQIVDLEDPRYLKSPAPAKTGTILLTTDGIHFIPPSVLSGVVRAADTARDVVSRLMSISEWMGGHDNATIVCMTPRSRVHVIADERAAGTLVLEDPFAELRLSVAYSADFEVTDSIHSLMSLADPSEAYEGKRHDRVSQNYFDFRENPSLVHESTPNYVREGRSARRLKSQPTAPVGSGGSVGSRKESGSSTKPISVVSSSEVRRSSADARSLSKKQKPSVRSLGKGRKSARPSRGNRPNKPTRSAKPEKKSRARKLSVDARPQLRIKILDEE